jgi:hypothetical protein
VLFYSSPGCVVLAITVLSAISEIAFDEEG